MAKMIKLLRTFMDIGQLVLENNTLKGLFTIYECGGHLGHVTNIILINFPFLHLKACIQFGKIWPNGF